MYIFFFHIPCFPRLLVVTGLIILCVLFSYGNLLKIERKHTAASQGASGKSMNIIDLLVYNKIRRLLTVWKLLKLITVFFFFEQFSPAIQY